uniref:Uncharacterized protein n=1 Tax=Meloidogyne enterolobii TaxID=390850 RepID=A0A6V7WU29_MELEN|nr:unnamed protein product [Meloidogyne enterolobii]
MLKKNLKNLVYLLNAIKAIVENVSFIKNFVFRKLQAVPRLMIKTKPQDQRHVPFPANFGMPRDHISSILEIKQGIQKKSRPRLHSKTKTEKFHKKSFESSLRVLDTYTEYHS